MRKIRDHKKGAEGRVSFESIFQIEHAHSQSHGSKWRGVSQFTDFQNHRPEFRQGLHWHQGYHELVYQINSLHVVKTVGMKQRFIL
jgi:hypothetical protein